MCSTNSEATVEELLSDPMMGPLFDHSRTTADDVRSLMREACDKLAKVRTAEREQAEMQSRELRAAARRFLVQIKKTANLEVKRALAEQALELAQRAKQLERGR